MIYESPDGGKTVFVRPPHQLNKQDVTVDILNPETKEINDLWFAWRDILTASKNNPALKESLDRAQIIYELSRHDKN
jgi:hypothetical protein